MISYSPQILRSWDCYIRFTSQWSNIIYIWTYELKNLHLKLQSAVEVDSCWTFLGVTCFIELWMMETLKPETPFWIWWWQTKVSGEDFPLSQSNWILCLFGWLVVWLPSILFSQKFWESHHPNWRTQIFRGVAQSPTSDIFPYTFQLASWVHCSV